MTLTFDEDHHDMIDHHAIADDNSMYTTSSQRAVGIAFTITIVAGLATAIGGAIVFFPSFMTISSSTTRNNNKKSFLSGSLAVAAGCITYLAFGDLLKESTEFISSDLSEDNGNLASLFSTLCFFSGISLVYILSFITNKIAPNTPHCHSSSSSTTSAGKNVRSSNSKTSKDDDNQDKDVDTEMGTNVLLTTQVVNDLNEEGEEKDSSEKKDSSNNRDDVLTETDSTVFDGSVVMTEEEQQGLWKSGITTAIALILHNLPEGMITFVTSQSNPTIGIALAIGIALHNIPEGISVALPIYYATNGNKWKAFTITLLTGLAPIFGALIAYVILETRDFSNITFGIMFAMASGMLIYIAIKHLLKTAYKYDPNDQVTTNCFVLGMALIAIALVVLDATGNHNHGIEDNGHGHHGGGGHGSSDHHGSSSGSSSSTEHQEAIDETMLHDYNEKTVQTTHEEESSSNHHHDDGHHDDDHYHF